MEELIAQDAQLLADYFAKERELPLGHTGISPIEKMYVDKLINNIYSNYNALLEQELENKETF